MDNKEKINELIEKYVSGSITEKERQELFSIIKEKPEIGQEMQIRKDIAGSLKYVGNKELKSILDKIHSEEFGHESPTKLLSLKRLLVVAAVLIGVLLASIFAINAFSEEIDGKQLYAANYNSYQASFQTRGEVSSDLTRYKEAFVAGNYEKAIALIASSSAVLDGEVQLTAGISALETGDLLLAKEYFQKVIDNNDLYGDHAIWYLALSYLKEDNVSLAKSLLKELSENDQADHHLEAKGLYNKIK